MRLPNLNPRPWLRTFVAAHFDTIGLVAGLLVFVTATLLVWKVDPDAGSLPPGTFQLLTLPPLLLFLMIHTAKFAYKRFLRSWWDFLASDDPKVFQDVLPELNRLPGATSTAIGCSEQTTNAIAYYRLKFRIRCTRTVLSWLPFLALLYFLRDLVQLALAQVPH